MIIVQRQERRDLVYLVSVFRAMFADRLVGKLDSPSGNDDAQKLFDMTDAVLRHLGDGMSEDERRAAQNQTRYKTLQVVTRAAHPAPLGNEVVITIDDINELFYHGREECVLCERSGKDVKRCKVYKIFRKYDLHGVCDKECDS